MTNNMLAGADADYATSPTVSRRARNIAARYTKRPNSISPV
jgi:hypothetical protein